MKPADLVRTLVCASVTLVAAPAEARFLQVDPVGYKNQINLYAYVNDDPLNQADPTGMDAIILMQDETHIQIILPVTFAGNAASSANIAAFTSNVQQRWTGTFDGINVKTTVVQGSSALAPNVHNAVTITSGNTAENQGHSVEHSGPPATADITTKDVKGYPIPLPNGDLSFGEKSGSDTYAHAAGHLMGVPDRPADNGTLMGTGSGNRVTGADIRDMMQKPYTPSGMNNTVIKCADDPKKCQ